MRARGFDERTNVALLKKVGFGIVHYCRKYDRHHHGANDIK
jgi:hypothetical protein